MQQRRPASFFIGLRSYDGNDDNSAYVDTSAAPETGSRTRYRSEIKRHGNPGPPQTYYDGGDYGPYSLESLVDLLRAEARLPYSTLAISVELTGSCPGVVLREMALRLSSLGLPRFHARIEAEGHAPVVLGREFAA
jgi:hypothetical protein